MKPFYTNWWLRGKTLFVKYVDENGIRQRMRVPVEPTLYVKDSGKEIDVEAEPQTDIFGNRVVPMEFDSPADARDFVYSYESTPGFKIFGFNRFDYTKINALFPDAMEYALNLIRIGIIDIETEIGETFATADNPHQRINAISLYTPDGELKTWSLYDVPDSTFCKDEKTLLQNFLVGWKIADIDIVTGWNSTGFDMPYIVKRLEMILGEEYASDISPFGGYRYVQVETKWGAMQTQVEIHGIAQLDLLELYRKFVLQKQESYKLDFIAQKDLGVGKLEFDGSLKDLYTKEPAKFIQYNRTDVMRVYQINAKRQLIENAIGIAYTSKCQFQDSFLTTRPWDVIIANYLSSINVQVPFKGGGEKSEKFEGAFVKEPIVGFHEWALTFDLGSLYPSIMVAYNISPEMMVDPSEFIRIRPSDIINETDLYKQAKAKADSLGATLCANGAMFYKDKQGFLPLLVERGLKDRAKYKKQMKEWKKEAERVKEEIKKRKTT